MTAATAQELLRIHDDQLRTAAELDGATDTGRIGPLWVGRFGPHGFISYRDLAGLRGEELDHLIAAGIAWFAADPAVEDVEWKTRGHDAPADLARHLLAAGFTAQDPETVMIGEAALLLAAAGTAPDGVAVRRAGSTAAGIEADIAGVAELHATVFHRPVDDQADALRRVLAHGDGDQVWLAEADGTVVSACRLARVAGTRFAGLFGGATLPQWRRRGVYRQLTAARAAAALDLGADLLYAECTAFSRPILARAGLVAVTTTTPYLWRREGDAATAGP